MKLTSLEAIMRALQEGGVRYLIAGGLAVNAHGYMRMTHDVDIVLALDSRNITLAFDALAMIGYRPIVPITAGQFADSLQREAWIRDKGMVVLNFFSGSHKETAIDVFVTEPFVFEAEYGRALYGLLAPGLHVRFVSIPTLIEMKRVANRPRDRDDIEHLQIIMDLEAKHE